MPNPYFKFKQFTIWHDKCAMKVGTDGVLLGAWANTNNIKRVLDVGTGTGLISLMIAQRSPNAIIDAIEIDEIAFLQAKNNFLNSIWSDRINAICCDFKKYTSQEKYDLIVSNPPYFVDALKSPDQQRSLARHVGSLNYESLFATASKFLSETGTIDIIIPAEAENSIIDIAWKHKFFPVRKLNVYTKPSKQCRRILFSFSFQEKKCEDQDLHIKLTDNQFSNEYNLLTRDFYLKI
jgi:tRNA1Val (adenine37-N6)-methyltransferase